MIFSFVKMVLTVKKTGDVTGYDIRLVVIRDYDSAFDAVTLIYNYIS